MIAGDVEQDECLCEVIKIEYHNYDVLFSLSFDYRVALYSLSKILCTCISDLIPMEEEFFE